MYRVVYTVEAQKELNKLDGSIRPQVLRAIEKRRHNPFVESSRLSGKDGTYYRIKFREAGLRLIYQVVADEVVIIIITIGRRDANAVYKKLR